VHRRVVALGIASLLLVTACSSGSHAPGTGTTAPNIGPNSSSASNPGPQSTVNGPETVSGRFAVNGGCVALRSAGSVAGYELVLPAGWRVARGALVVDGRTEAHTGDLVFVAGRTTTTHGRCGTVFTVTHLVSVVRG